MAFIWNLRRWLASEHNIYRPTELRTVLAERAGYHLTVQAVSTLMKERPRELRLRTIEAICQSLNCKLSDFCEVSPDAQAAVETQQPSSPGSGPKQRKHVSNLRREQISLPAPPKRPSNSDNEPRG